MTADRAQLLLVDWPDAPQSTLRLAAPGITRADERWPGMFVANFAIGGNFSSRINTVLREQKGLGADYIDSLAQATERAAAQFEQASPQAASYIRQASGHIQGVAEVVRERDVRELVGEIENFARRQPTVFFGGAVILGVAAIRFLKSSRSSAP